QESGLTPTRSWALTMMRRSRLLLLGRRMFGSVIGLGFNRAPVRKPKGVRASGSAATGLLIDMVWYAAVVAVGALAAWRIGLFVQSHSVDGSRARRGPRLSHIAA